VASIADLSKGIGNWLSIPWPVVCVLLVIALFSWLCWRTRSWHFVRAGLWRVAMRRSRSTDREISKWIESRERLMDFRYFFGVQARTLAQARRIGRWALEMDEDLDAVARCGDHFDREHCRLDRERIPNRAAMAFVVLAASVLALMSLTSVIAVSTPLALLQFNDSGTLFSRNSPTNTVPASDLSQTSTRC